MQETLQLFQYLFLLEHMKRTALQNEGGGGGAQFHDWLFGPEKFWRLSRNEPQLQKIVSLWSTLRSRFQQRHNTLFFNLSIWSKLAKR